MMAYEKQYHFGHGSECIQPFPHLQRTERGRQIRTTFKDIVDRTGFVCVCVVLWENFNIYHLGKFQEYHTVLLTFVITLCIGSPKPCPFVPFEKVSLHFSLVSQATTILLSAFEFDYFGCLTKVETHSFGLSVSDLFHFSQCLLYSPGEEKGYPLQ